MKVMIAMYQEAIAQVGHVLAINMHYRRSGFDCEILMIANCEFFRSLQSKESQSTAQAYSIT